MRQPSPTTRKISTSFAKSFAKPVNAVSKCCLHRLKNPGSLSNPTPPMMASQLSDGGWDRLRASDHMPPPSSDRRAVKASRRSKISRKHRSEEHTSELPSLLRHSYAV